MFRLCLRGRRMCKRSKPFLFVTNTIFVNHEDNKSVRLKIVERVLSVFPCSSDCS